MRDSYGRNIDYLRISVTDRCNMRCVYCMPEEGIEKLPHGDVLTYDEIVRTAGIAAKIGIKKIKITGGEPLVRKGVTGLIRELKALDGIEQVTLTTNGTMLRQYLDELCEAGVDGINISIDSLDREGYARLARRDMLPEALEGLSAALERGLNVKINCVPIASDEELTALAGLARERDLQVRFIEIMPLGEGKRFGLRTEDELISMLSKTYGEPAEASFVSGNGPARYISFEGFRGNVGFISAISHKFCSSCNRLRLTADGHIKTCLQFENGCFLREILRDGTDDETIMKTIEKAVYEKPRCHEFLLERDDADARLMSQIGG